MWACVCLAGGVFPLGDRSAVGHSRIDNARLPARQVVWLRAAGGVGAACGKGLSEKTRLGLCEVEI